MHQSLVNEAPLPLLSFHLPPTQRLDYDYAFDDLPGGGGGGGCGLGFSDVATFAAMGAALIIGTVIALREIRDANGRRRAFLGAGGVLDHVIKGSSIDLHIKGGVGSSWFAVDLSWPNLVTINSTIMEELVFLGLLFVARCWRPFSKTLVTQVQ